MAGCATIVREPSVTIQKTSITGVDSSGVEVEFLVGVNNPNSFDLSLLGYNYDLQLMAIPFSSGGNLEEVNFPSGSHTTLRLPLRIRFADVIELLKSRPEIDRIPYRMSARLNLRTPLGEVAVPVERNDVFQLPEMYRASNFIRRFLPTPKKDL